ncbi:MAG: integrase [Arenimonas sp.]|nr:integrase [Arenimonas sp.]
MGLSKRGDVWWVAFTTPNGERIRRSAGTSDQTAAQEYLDRLKVRYWEEQRLGVKPDRSWQDAAVRWVKETSHKRSHDKDVANLRWLHPFLGHLMLSQVTRDVVEKIGEKKAAQSSPSTANRTLALVRSILRRAKDDWGWVDHIPKVRLYREPKKRICFLSPDEARRLLNELPLHLRDMVQLALSTGLRQRNVSYLRWDQVDMSRRVAWIHPDEAKAGRAIGVPLNEDALDVLRRRLGRHPEYVFAYQGQPVARCSTRAWKQAVARAGIEPGFRWHDLRHTWASWHVQNGTPLQELMELGGWASYEMVLRYAHLAADHLRGAASRIDGTFLTHKQKPQLVRLS